MTSYKNDNELWIAIPSQNKNIKMIEQYTINTMDI